MMRSRRPGALSPHSRIINKHPYLLRITLLLVANSILQIFRQRVSRLAGISNRRAGTDKFALLGLLAREARPTGAKI
jgi:hypothetical protein